MPTASQTFSPLFQQLLTKRGLNDPAEIQDFLKASLFHDPFLMRGMKEAVARLHLARERGEKIMVHGDYDVDGVTSSAILCRTFSALKIQHEAFLPDREEDGYGVSERAIREAAQKGIKIIVTADCGITAKSQIQIARDLGLDVIVIDHHRIPNDGLPNATVILNPLQAHCPYPFKDLSAGGLAFKLAQALLVESADQLLDLAALSTVCDVAPLKNENRAIVKKGLRKLADRQNLGVRALAEVSGIKTKEMTAGHIGFTLGPRINAAGRMSSPQVALRLLMSESLREAQSLANVLDEENKARQKEEAQVLKEALSEVERVVNFNRDRVIVVGREGWHAGVIGIVAARLVEKFNRPSVVIAFDGKEGKGSGRSIKGVHLFNALDACKDCFIQFGGHEQAAGLSIEKDRLKEFREKINLHANETYQPDVFVKKTAYDLEVGLDDFKAIFLAELEQLEPHGMGNPRPVFLTRNVTVHSKPERLTPQLMKFFVNANGMTCEVLFSDRHQDPIINLIQKGNKIDLYYNAKLKSWNGVQSLSLDAKDFVLPRE